jgi:NADH:ubiquinone oxidoreductase subunit H
LSFILFDKSYSIVLLTNLGFFLLFTIFIICVLVELGRTPFDYMESESELVSGFNTEYSSVSFVLLFLKEYGSLLFFSFLISTVFFYGYFMFTVLIFSLFIIIRSSYPRLRYDKLIGLI